MKHLLTIILFLFFLRKTISIKIPRYKLARFALALRKLKIYKDSLRELEETTDEDQEQSLPDIDSPRNFSSN
jgi:hypothetical protein